MAHKKILVFSIMAFLAAALVALIVMVSLLSENTDVRPPAVRQDTKTFDERMYYSLSEALSCTGETGTIDLTFDEEEFNLLINAALRSAGGGAVRGIAVTVNDGDTVSLAMGVSCAGVRTVLRAKVAVSETDSYLQFSCTEIRLGGCRLSAASANLFAGRFFENTALFPATSVKNGSWLIRFEKQVLAGYLTGYLAEGENNLELVRVALERCFRQEGMLDFCFGQNGRIGAQISLEKLSYNEARDGQTFSDISVNTLDEQLETLLNRGALDFQNLNLGARYLTMGYQKLKEEEKAIVSAMDFSSVGIVSNTSYTGMIHYDQRTLASIVLEHFPGVLPASGEVFFRINEEDLNALVMQGDVIGSAAVFARFTGAGYKVSSIVLESFHADIRKDTLIINFILSVNGRRLLFSSSLESLPTHITSITISVKDVRMGELAATEAESAAVFAMTESVFAAQNWIFCDEEAQAVTFDFESAVNSNWLLHLAFTRLGGIITTSLAEDGYIKVAIEL
jgi:ABC-type uncharacterized transport system YnjBCD ATPase subunit